MYNFKLLIRHQKNLNTKLFDNDKKIDYKWQKENIFFLEFIKHPNIFNFWRF